jgi:beta-phosphoglucomutase-like phosphatase (HAD superfamily)
VGVEDSSNGIRAVHAAGMTVVAFPNPTYPPKPDALALADQVAADLEDVRSRLLALVAAPTAAEDRR